MPYGCPTVINKNVFTSPKEMVEFSGEKNKISALAKKTLLTYVKKVNEKTFSNLFSDYKSR